MKKIWFVLAVAVMVSATVGTDAKASFVGLYNTGVSGGHNSIDTNWTVNPPGVAPAVGANIVKSGGVIGDYWLADSPVSSWLKLTSEPPVGDYGIEPTGDYEFETTFTSNVNTSLSGRFLADNQLKGILLNNVSVFNLGPVSEFKLWTNFAFNVGAGANTLKFIVENYSGQGQNPVGLRVEFAKPIPEPAAVASWLVGSLCAVGMIGYRRRRSGVLASTPV